MLYGLIKNEPSIFNTVKFISKDTKKNQKLIKHIKRLPKYRPNPLLPLPLTKMILSTRSKIKIEDYYTTEIFTYKDKSKGRLDFYPKGKLFEKSEKNPVVILIPGFCNEGSDRYIVDTCRELWTFGGIRTVIINDCTNIGMEIDEHYDLRWFKEESIDDVSEYLSQKESTKKANLYNLGFSGGSDLVFYYTGLKAEKNEATRIKGSISISPSFDFHHTAKKMDSKSIVYSNMLGNFKKGVRRYYSNEHFINFSKKRGIEIDDYEQLTSIREYHAKVSARVSLNHSFGDVSELYDYLSGNTRMHLITSPKLIISSIGDPVMA